MEEKLPIILYIYTIQNMKLLILNCVLLLMHTHDWPAWECFTQQLFKIIITGVALPFRDLHQPTQNITYFTSMA